MKNKEPLYRKINWRTYKVEKHFNKDSEARHDRNTKKGISSKMDSKEHGRDYTPLFKFLLSKINHQWTEVHQEAVFRLDTIEPLFYMVKLNQIDVENCSGYFRIGNSYFSTLMVDEAGLLQKIKPDFIPNNIVTCSCCTFTFNGKVIDKI
jgi:hypothetical protein